MLDKIGQMDSCYFVPRSSLLSWINHTLHLQLSQIQQLGTGAVYCQLFDSLYPGHVPISKVNWRAKHQYEFIQNFKILQGVFERAGVDKKIEVMKLVKCRCQDNLEFIQWVKRFVELQGGSEEGYDAVGRRGRGVVVELPTKRKDTGSNKENMKKSAFMNATLIPKPTTAFSVTSGKSSVRRSQSPDHLNLTYLRTPNKDQSLHRRIMSKTQRYPLQSIRKDDSNKLDQIRNILKHPINEHEQMTQIKRLLTTEDIVEEEELEFI